MTSYAPKITFTPSGLIHHCCSRKKRSRTGEKERKGKKNPGEHRTRGLKICGHIASMGGQSRGGHWREEKPRGRSENVSREDFWIVKRSEVQRW